MNLACRVTALTVLVAIGLARPLAGEEPTPERDAGNVLERFEVPKDGDILLLPVKLGGKTYRFFLDTGSTVNVFDSSLPLGDPVDEASAAGAGGAARVKLHNAPAATVGGLSLKTADPVVAFDFAPLREVSGYDVYGLIGMPFLRRHVVQVDFDTGELLVLKRPGRDCGDATAIAFGDDSLPRVGATIGGDDRQSFVLDTGCGHTATLATGTFDAALRRKDLTVVGTTFSETLSGTSAQRVGRMGRLSVGDSSVRNAVVIDSRSDCLGRGFCARFVMTLDLANDRVYLKKGKNFDRADTHDLSGLHLLHRDGKAVAASVEARSAAEAAGLKAGDVLVRVDDAKVEAMSMFQLRRLLSAETRGLRVTVRRGEAETEVVMALSRAK